MPTSGPKLTEPNPIAGLLRRGLTRDPAADAIVSTSERLSWEKLERVSHVLACQYLAIGLERGDRVASLMPNRPALLVHYLACLKAGLVATPLNYRYMPPEMDHALEVSGASMLLVHSERQEDVAACEKARTLKHGIVHYGGGKEDGRHYEELVDRKQVDRELCSVEDGAPAFLYFTSGSTGKPKGVTHTQATLGWMMASQIQAMSMKPDDTMLPASSFSHIGGSLFSLTALAAGARVAVPRSGLADDVLPLLRDLQPTVVWILPSALLALVRDHNAESHDFRSVRLCFSGGDKLSGQLEREFTAIAGFPVDEGYGMTEIGGAALNPPQIAPRVGSVGKLVPGYERSIRDEDSKELPDGATGRLWIRSPCNTIGYWENPAATAATIVDGWLDTGDMMQADAEGYLWFHGRKKQIIVHDGSNICPQEVEESLVEHASIREAGVIGIHDLVHGENVRAYVTLKPDFPRPTASELIQFSRERVGYKAPEQIVFLDAMPLNATGKVDRVGLKEMAEHALR